MAVERCGEGWEALIAGRGAEPAVIPAIVYAELLVGVQLADDAQRAAGRKARIEAIASRE